MSVFQNNKTSERPRINPWHNRMLLLWCPLQSSIKKKKYIFLIVVPLIFYQREYDVPLQHFQE